MVGSAQRRSFLALGLGTLAVIGWVLLGGLAFAPGIALGQPLTDELERLIAKAKLSTDQVGVSVVELARSGGSEQVLVDIESSRARIPASNQKLLTTGAALLILGKDYTYRTEFQMVGDTLVIKGSGDPSLGDPEMLNKSSSKLTLPDLLAAISGAIKQAGVTKVSEIVVDDRIFDRTFVHPTWKAKHLTEWYGAQVAGLNFHANVLSVFPSPVSKRGAAPIYKVEPEANFIEIENSAKSMPGEPNAVDIERLGETDKYRLKGSVGQSAQGPIEVPMHNNPLVFGRVIAEQLARQGVTVGSGENAGIKAVRAVNLDESFENPRVVAVVTTPLTDVVKRCNTVSMNLYAECMFKLIGFEAAGRRQSGSWDNGAFALRRQISDRLGPEAAANTVIADGSGLSVNNKVSPRTMTRWLALLAGDTQVSDSFLKSLATPSEGGLKKRMGKAGLKNSLQAKTGHIDGVSCLSGYVTHESSGTRIAFSILTNDLNKGDKLGASMEMQVEMVKALDVWLTKRCKEGKQAAAGG